MSQADCSSDENDENQLVFNPHPRVSEEYQAARPAYDPAQSSAEDSSVMVWTPNRNFQDAEIRAFIQLARSLIGMDEESALGILFRSNYNVQAANNHLHQILMEQNPMCLFSMDQEHQACFDPGYTMINIPVQNFKSEQLIPRKFMQNFQHLPCGDGQSSLFPLQRVCNGDDGEEKDSDDTTSESHDGTESTVSDAQDKNTGVANEGTSATHFLTSEGMPTMVASTDEELELLQLVQQQAERLQVLDLIDIEMMAKLSPTFGSQPPLWHNPNWTTEEGRIATLGLKVYGHDFALIAELLRNKSEADVYNFLLEAEIFEGSNASKYGDVHYDKPTCIKYID